MISDDEYVLPPNLDMIALQRYPSTMPTKDRISSVSGPLLLKISAINKPLSAPAKLLNNKSMIIASGTKRNVEMIVNSPETENLQQTRKPPVQL